MCVCVSLRLCSFFLGLKLRRLRRRRQSYLFIVLREGAIKSYCRRRRRRLPVASAARQQAVPYHPPLPLSSVMDRRRKSPHAQLANIGGALWRAARLFNLCAIFTMEK